MSPKKKDEPTVNPLYAVGSTKPPMTQDEIASTFAPDEEEAKSDDTPKQPATHLPKDLPPGPSVRRRKHKGLRFGDIYVTRSLSIDKRIVASFDDFMESGDTKTQIANQVILKILLENGYNIDPDILSKPVIKSEPD